MSQPVHNFNVFIYNFNLKLRRC